MYCSLPGFSVHGIFQAKILEQVAFPTPRDLPDPRIKAMSFVSSALAGRFLTTAPLGKPESIYTSVQKAMGNEIGSVKHS